MTSAYSLIRRRGAAADALLVAQEVAALSGPVIREIAPLLAQAELETANALRQWIAQGKGEDRYTAYQHARVLAQLRAAFDTIRSISPALTSALGTGASRAGVLSGQHLTALVDRNSRRFSTSLEAPIRIDFARVIATGQGLIPKFRSSAARYSEGVQTEIRRQLAIGVLKGETYSGLMQRLSQRSSIARAAGVEPTPANAANGLLRPAGWQLERLARTEMAHASDVQAMESYRQARQQIPDLRRQWCATLDMRLCASCKEMHNAISQSDGSFSAMLPGPPLHPNCVPPGTMIDTPAGPRPIESIQVGDEVVGGLTGLPRRVLQVHRNPFHGSLVTLSTLQGTVFLTPNHPALTARGWVDAGKLELSDKLYCHLENDILHFGSFAHSSNVMQMLLSAVDIHQISQRSYSGEVWNLSVESDESYIANGVVVHNCRCVALPWREGWGELLEAA